ncbi:MAG: glycosyltransferase family 2 protein [Desulfitobacterium sp.]
MPTISVIMLTYNRENLVGKAIESILEQTFRDFEFIIVDNGSSDRSGEIARWYAGQDKRIRFLRRERGNIGSGRNAGLETAQGEYVAFIDDDDYAEPDFLAFLYNLISEYDADVAICGAADKIFDEKRIMTAEEALIELMWRKRYNMAFPTKLFSRELAGHIRFPESDKYDDISQMHRMLAYACRVVYHGLPKYTFYRHPGNNSAWTTDHSLLTRETLKEYLRAYRERTEWLSGLFPASAPAFRFFEWSFMISMVEKLSRYGITESADLLDKMKTELWTHQVEFLSCAYIQSFEKEWMEKFIVRRKQLLSNQ